MKDLKIVNCQVEAMEKDNRIQSLVQEGEERDELIAVFTQKLQDRVEVIAVLNQTVQDKDDKITILTQTLQDRDEVIAVLNQTVQDKDDMITILTQTLQDRDEVIAVLKRTVQDKDDKITILTQTLQDRDEVIAVLNPTVQDKDDKIIMQDKDNKITRLTQTLQDRDEVIAVLKRTMQDKDDKITILTQTLQDRDEVIAVLKRTLQDKDDKITILTQTLQDRDEVITVLNRTVQDKDDKITILTQTLQDKDEVIAVLNPTVQDKDDKVTILTQTLQDKDEVIKCQRATILELTDQLNLAKKEAEEEKRKAGNVNRYQWKQYTEYTFEDLKQATDHFNENNKLGEGGFGTVYKGQLHGMDVAVKRGSEGLQQQRQFQTEVELLSRIHHPHVVLLLGACTEEACIVYEYMSNGNLEDRLNCKDGSPPLPWYLRLRICSEIATGLLFLHCRDQPIIHRDLKPSNILLDFNHVSKISDVGIAKLVDCDITEMKTTMPVGTFAYMDPEYLRTGFVSCSSDVYALGIIILQLLTGKPPPQVLNIMERALDTDHGFEEILDRSAGDWPLAEAMELGLLGVQCTQRSPSDRPNLEEVLDTLKNIRECADEAATKALTTSTNESDEMSIPSCFFCPISQDIMTNPYIAADGFTYDHDTIKYWLQTHDTSPMTNLKLSHKNLTPNHSVKSAIQEWSDKGLIQNS